jgi:hypothetical protein
VEGADTLERCLACEAVVSGGINLSHVLVCALSRLAKTWTHCLGLTCARVSQSRTLKSRPDDGAQHGKAIELIISLLATASHVSSIALATEEARQCSTVPTGGLQLAFRMNAVHVLGSSISSYEKR